MNARIEQGWFLAPIEVYGPAQIISNKVSPLKTDLIRRLNQLGYQKVSQTERLRSLQYVEWSEDLCLSHLPELPEGPIDSCLAMKDEESELSIIAWRDQSQIEKVLIGEPPQAVEALELPPPLIAQYIGEQPLLRQIVSLSEVPLHCIQALTAIEDSDFLEHSGVSLTGTLRAIKTNIFSGRYAQGGSTLTQQLVKNYFLNPEKTLKRKLTEQLMALLLERRLTKDQILEIYLNLIYLGQSGTFQVRGYGAAAQHYFQRPLAELGLPECALLAALLNSPGRYHPLRHPDQAKARRDLVLKKMFERGSIDENQLNQFLDSDLRVNFGSAIAEPSPFYLQSLLAEVERLEIDQQKGLRLFSAIDLNWQQQAENLTQKHLERLDPNPQAEPLQAAVIVVDLELSKIIALVGGRNYKLSQFNRALQSRRQVGSLMKPFVYLAALESFNKAGQNFEPLSLISDEPLKIKLPSGSWQPENYDKKFHGEIPLFWALIRSYNVATARLGFQVGLESIIDVSRRLGLRSEIKAYPSLTLGSYEMTPLEVAQAYANLARMGRSEQITSLNRIEDLEGQVLWQPNREEWHQTVAAENVAKMIAMMKLAFSYGTAASARRLGYREIAAGKTGTTSETKDAWFVGFTKNLLTLVWIGFDHNTSHGLTGASGALPLWVEIMKQKKSTENSDFEWPQGVEVQTIYPDQLLELFSNSKNTVIPTEPVELVF